MPNSCLIGKMAVPLGWGARNNQPHIHLTSRGYLLGPNPLLKGSKRKGFSHADSILIWKLTGSFAEFYVGLPFCVFLNGGFSIQKLPTPQICSQFSPAVFCVLFGRNQKKPPGKAVLFLGADRRQVCSSWHLIPKSQQVFGVNHF